MQTILIILLCSYIFLLTGVAMGDVRGGVFEWGLPLAVFVFTSFPAILGFLIGRMIEK